MKLNYSHIEFVLGCLKENTTHIKNMKQYILAALYNAPITINNYYSSLVQHDMVTDVSRPDAHAVILGTNGKIRQISMKEAETILDQMATCYLVYTAQGTDKFHMPFHNSCIPYIRRDYLLL